MKKALILLGSLALLSFAFGCSELSTDPQGDIVEPTGEGVQPATPKAAGDLIATVPLPVPGVGVSVAVDCDGLVYYTIGDGNLYVMDKDGVLMDTLPVTDSATGASLNMDEMAWDASREVLWAQLHDSNPVDVYQVDRATGVATFQWTSQTNSAGTYRDGLAYDGTDDTIWLSGDVSETVEHYQADGTYIGQITPKDASGGTLGAISGVIVGVGDLLYLGQNGRAEIVQVKKSNGDFVESFASPGGTRDEGLECDPVNFAPKLALWSREFYAPGHLAVIELEEGTCTCGGEPAEIPVPFDIHPTSCPNPINPKSRGVTPAAILGTMDFDVSQIDPATVMVEGVSPIRWELDDVATPFEPYQGKQGCYDCNTLGPDGYTDLTLKFSTQELVAAMGRLEDDCIVLHLTGNLLPEFGGTAIVGEDVVRIPGATTINAHEQ